MIIFEISNSWIKALWGKTTLKDLQISGMISRSVSLESQTEELTKIIHSIGDEKKLKKHKPIILCIPRDQTTLRNLKFPAKDESELKNIVGLHVTQQVPYAREEIVYNYDILGKTQAGLTEMLLGIVHRELLIKHYSLLEGVNLAPDNVLLGTFSLMKVLRRAKLAKESDAALIACIDVDAEFSDLVIFRGTKILFSKCINIGHSQFKEGQKVENFLGSLKQAMVVFQSEKRGSISRVYLSGAKQEAVNLVPHISGALSLPVETVRYADAVSAMKDLKDIDETLNRVSVSGLLGSALEPLSTRLNFILPEAKLRSDVRVMTKNFIITGSLAVYFIVFLFLGFMGKVYNSQTYLSRLTSQVMSLKRANEDSTVALDKIKAVRNFTRETDSFLYYYHELTKVMPKKITVDRLIYSKKKEFSMVGKGTDMGEIFKFVTILSDVGKFGKVELRYSRKKVEDQNEFNEFEIMCHID
ncbi:MAG: pilus assembly protein PilM [Candidatus Omnitrophica bacterium]|nr:pilus assembly protein PilM [Candidatus Omnitrophota bacterium]